MEEDTHLLFSDGVFPGTNSVSGDLKVKRMSRQGAHSLSPLTFVPRTLLQLFPKGTLLAIMWTTLFPLLPPLIGKALHS